MGDNAEPPTPSDAPETSNVDRLKSVVAILIGVISVAGALVTWRAVNLGSAATDADRTAVMQAVRKEQSRTISEIQLRSEMTYYSRYRGDRQAADSLQALAEGTSDPVEREELREEARVIEEVANNLQILTFDLGLVQDPGTTEESFNQERRRRELLTQDPEAFQANPERTAAEADSMRSRGQALIGTLVFFALSIVLLSAAEVLGGRLRLPLASVGLLIFAVAGVVAFVREF
jgi:hypothetical protein